MEIWTVVGVDSQATEKNKFTGEVRNGVKYYLVGDNFEPGQPNRYYGQVCSALFVSHDERMKFGYDAMPGDKIRIGYNRWGRISLFEPVK